MTEKLLQQAVDLVHKHGSVSLAARKTGMARTTLADRHKEAVRQGFKPTSKEPIERLITLPELPSPDAPIQEVLRRLAEDSDRRLEAQMARQWVKINVNVSGPYGLVHWGDPHLDDDGCAHSMLQRHVNVIQKNPRMFSVGMGDYENNWTGRLSRLFGNQETSHRTAKRLVQWWVEEVRPVLMIRGNHDLWSGAGDLLQWLSKPSDTMTEDWCAKVEFHSPGGNICRLWAAHDFPGHSMWNTLHAPQRKAVMSGARAHIYAAGHRHTWGMAKHEDPESNHVYTLLRARGYKLIDAFGNQLGHGSQQYGASITVVVNPEASNPSQIVHPFDDPEMASDYLNWLHERIHAMPKKRRAA
jgi:hypothetical protein